MININYFFLCEKIYKKYTFIILLMTHYECIPCEFETNLKSNYTQHLLTNKHKFNVNPLFNCNTCKYKTLKKTDYDRHLLSKKHLKNMSIQNNNQISVHDLIQLQNEKIELLMNEIIKLRKLNEKNTNKIIEINNQNTQKIIKEAMNLKQSILTMLNIHFKNTPSIYYIKQESFFKALEEEYKANINDGTNSI